MKKLLFIILLLNISILSYSLNFSVAPTGFVVDLKSSTTKEIYITNNTSQPMRLEAFFTSDPEFEEKVMGEAIIRETFKVSKVGTIGGFMVTSGKITRDSSARVIRDGVVIFDGKLASLKHFKDDVKEVGNAQEGGLMIENYNDIKVDDVIEAYIMEEIKR